MVKIKMQFSIIKILIDSTFDLSFKDRERRKRKLKI